MSMVRYEGETSEGEKVAVSIPLILALRGEEPVLPGAMPDTIRAIIRDDECVEKS